MLSKKGRDSMGYDGSLKFDTEINEKGFSASIKKIGSIAKGGLAVIGGSVAGVATAFGVMIPMQALSRILAELKRCSKTAHKK